MRKLLKISLQLAQVKVYLNFAETTEWTSQLINSHNRHGINIVNVTLMTVNYVKIIRCHLN